MPRRLRLLFLSLMVRTFWNHLVHTQLTPSKP